jgi:adenosylmethionine-8-amino-7-oxononanoate aminotransferase
LREFFRLPYVSEVRQCGFMVGIELNQNVGHRVILEARKRGAILRPLGNVIVLMPPLSISTKELEQLISIALASIKAVCE